MKKLFLLLTLLLSFHSAWGQPVEVNGIWYFLHDTNQIMTATVTDQTYADGSWSRKKYVGDLVIPSTITVDGTEYTVTKIVDECFARESNLTSVTLPNTLTALLRAVSRIAAV